MHKHLYILNSDPVTRFLIKSSLFFLPIVAVFIFPFTVFLLSGEFLSVEKIVNRQISSSKEVLYQSAFTGDTDMPYKVLMTEKRNPEIIVLGFSRTLTFKSSFFKNPNTFYNAGRAVHDSSSLYEYLNQLPKDSKLKVIMLDLSDFLDDKPPQIVNYRSSLMDIISLFLTSSWREVYISYANHKFSFTDLVDKSRHNDQYIGLSSILKHAGFRTDGSYSHGDYADTVNEINDVQSKIAQSVVSTTIQNEPKVSQENLKSIEKFIALCKERNIYVIGYLSPYSSVLFRKEQSLDDLSGIYKTAPKILSTLLIKYDFPFYDLRNNNITGSSDLELYDAGHTTEKGTLRLLSYLSSHEQKLSGYVDIFSIKSKIAKEQF